MDIVASVAFWYLMYLLQFVPDSVFYALLGLLLAVMVAYRLYCAKTSPDECGVEIPYTCGYVLNSGKELFLVATVHISPRAPKDVEAVIDKTIPDITMIELDDERLDRMRGDVEVQQPQEPRQEDLQRIRITEANGAPSTVFAQRALWNAERSGEAIAGDVEFDKSNEYGLESAGRDYRGKLVLVRRGSPNGEFAPFALKAHNAALAGAKAVLVINTEDKLPVNRIGGGTLLGDMRVAFNTCSCGFPPIPVLLLRKGEGQRLAELCGARAELEVLADEYPRRTLRRRLCQSCALIFSGIGILYGIIQCCDVEVGAEFIAAEEAAAARGIPCTCIDVDLNRFWSRLGWAVLPTPCNILQSLLSWLAFPRVLFRALFPPRGNVDVFGSMVLHATSFPLRTWVAFILAGMCASFVTSNLLTLFGFGVEQAGEGTGVVAKEDREVAQTFIMLGIEMFMLPQVYDAVAASRDEAMYNSIVEKSRHARRLVVAVGAGHANGILQRARTRGL
uniref:PA domain-containing protein n=1 Tax=Pyrodinium bahamense TaxID=73915 RepID=A0A7S0F9A6_9DINO